jgi:hypothetical protein
MAALVSVVLRVAAPAHPDFLPLSLAGEMPRSS